MPVRLTALVCMLAISAPHNSDWLKALPISSFGLRLDNEDIRVAVVFDHLGTALCETHQYPCGSPVDINGLHGSSSKPNSGKNARHSNINDLVCRALKRAEIIAIVKPTGLLRCRLSRTARRANINSLESR